MKTLIILAAVVLSGCSTLAHVEGTGDVGKVLRTMESVSCRAGSTSCNYGNGQAGRINRTIGNAKQLEDYPLELENIPYILQQLGTL